MAQILQNHFIHITIQKGRLVEENGEITKIVDETIKDDLIPFSDSQYSEALKNKLIESGNLDFEKVQKEINMK